MKLASDSHQVTDGHNALISDPTLDTWNARVLCAVTADSMNYALVSQWFRVRGQIGETGSEYKSQL